ncbi:MAG: MCE family protein [Actinomycetota bacterium]|nr:MCE family protein [Actinomycetota bacterium]
MRSRRARTAIGCALCLVLLSACNFNLYDVALPGGAATGSDVYRVTAEFADVLDLVPQSAVKVDDVTVGSVEKITLHGFTARVRLRLTNSVKLPANAEASIRQTSLLGEKFVSLSPPAAAPPAGRLRNGGVIPLSRTTRSTEIEEVLSALSLLLNGGGIEQLQTINQELSKALTGREPDVRDLLHQLDTFVGGLDAQKAQIIRALDGLDRLTTTLSAQRATIATALDTFGPGLKVLADERTQFTAMLTALSRLGVVGTRVIRLSREATLANLRALQPILGNLEAAGRNLPGALELLATYPFPRNFPAAVTGDFTRLSITFDLSLNTLIHNLGLVQELPGTPGLPATPGTSVLPKTPVPGLTGLAPALPTVPGLPALPQLPGLPLPAGAATAPVSDLVGLLLGGLGG